MKITKQQLVLGIMEYAESSKTNPQGPRGNCVYSTDDGQHCIIGQVLIDLGIDLDEAIAEADFSASDKYKNNPPAYALGVWDTGDTASYAAVVQEFADGDADGNIKQWDQVARFVAPDMC